MKIEEFYHFKLCRWGNINFIERREVFRRNFLNKEDPYPCRNSQQLAKFYQMFT